MKPLISFMICLFSITYAFAADDPEIPIADYRFDEFFYSDMENEVIDSIGKCVNWATRFYGVGLG